MSQDRAENKLVEFVDFNNDEDISLSKKTDALTYERAIEIFRYDGETGVLERKLKNGEWRVCGDKPNSHGYGQVWVDGKMYKTHRLVWLLVYGVRPEHEIDHIDRNPMNNKIENLRAASPSENQHNQGMRRNNTSGYPGVYFNKQRNKYEANICLNGKQTFLGYYPTAIEACTAYMIAKIKYHPSSPDAQQYLRELTLAG